MRRSFANPMQLSGSPSSIVSRAGVVLPKLDQQDGRLRGLLCLGSRHRRRAATTTNHRFGGGGHARGRGWLFHLPRRRHKPGFSRPVASDQGAGAEGRGKRGAHHFFGRGRIHVFGTQQIQLPREANPQQGKTLQCTRGKTTISQQQSDHFSRS